MTDEMMPIGEFGRRTHLTPKALRLYEKQGLVVPARVDAHNGYRWYHEQQVAGARLIGLLRGLDMSLEDIGAATQLDGGRAAAQLAAWWREAERTHQSKRRLVEHIHSIISGGFHAMYEIQTRHVPATRVLSIQRRLTQPHLFDLIVASRSAFDAVLDGAAPTGPFTVIFHGMVTLDDDGPVEIVQGCPDHIQPTAEVGVRVEPAHDEAFTRVTIGQMEFPELLAIYDAVACSPQVVSRQRSPLSCREVYLVDDPSSLGPDDPFCDITFPIG